MYSVWEERERRRRFTDAIGASAVLFHLLFAVVFFRHVTIMRATQEPDILGASVAAESVRVVVMEFQIVTLGTTSTVCTHEGALSSVSLPHETLYRGDGEVPVGN